MRNISAIQRKDRYTVIKLETAQQLHAAIRAYAIHGSCAAERQSTRHLVDDHGAAAMAMVAPVFALTAVSETPESFAERIVDEIGDFSSGKFQDSWDREGPGPFHKAMIFAKRTDDGTIEMHINAAYSEGAGEKKVADAIGVPILYNGSCIERHYETTGNRFCIPLADIKAAYETLGASFDARDVLRQLKPLDVDSGWSDPGRTTVIENDHLKATLTIPAHTVAPQHEEQRNRHRDFEYRIEDDYLTGPAKIGRHGARESVALSISIAPAGNRPTYDGAVQAGILEVADRIENIWQKSGQVAPSIGLHSNTL